MLKKSIKLIAIGLVAAFALAATGTVQAQDKKPTAAADAKKNGVVPFRGKINEIDKAAKTINIGKEKKRTIQITDKTKVTKDGKAATLSDANVGDEVGGSYRDVDGKLEANSLRIGPKPEGEAKPKSEKKKKE
jgi:Cu/Ag efflux protein CusF